MMTNSAEVENSANELGQAVSEAIENAINGIRHSSGITNEVNWLESDFHPIYGYGYSVRVRIECDGEEDKIIFKLYNNVFDGIHKKITSVTIGLYTWGDMEKLNGNDSVAKFFATFIEEPKEN